MMRRVALFGVLAGAAVFVPTAASAQEEPPPLPPPAETNTAAPTATTSIDIVHLRSGGLYRGRVTEIVPGDHVTIAVEKGETKVVRWTEIDRVVVGSIPGPASAAPPPPSAPMVGPLVRVHLTSSKTTILYRKPAGSTGWNQACTSPCNQDLPLGDTYRLTGNGVASSKEFRLEGAPGTTVDVALDPPSTTGMVLGGIMAGAGWLTGYVGLLNVLGASRGCGFDGDCSSADQKRETGLIVIGVGAVLSLAGLVVFLKSATTDLTQSATKDGAAGAAKPERRPLDAFRRQPSWSGPSSSSGRLLVGPPASFPLSFEHTF